MSQFILMGSLLIPLILAAFLLCSAFKERIRIHGWKALVWFLVYIGVIYAAEILFLKAGDLRWGMLCFAAVCGVLSFLFCKIMFRCALTEAIFVYFLIRCYTQAVFTSARILQLVFWKFYREMSEKNSFLMWYILALLFSVWLIWIFMKKGVRKMISKTENMKFWNYIWLIPLILYGAGSYQIEVGQLSASEVDWKILMPVLWILGVFFLYTTVVKMAIEISEAGELHETQRVHKLQSKYQMEQHENMKNYIEKSRNLRKGSRQEFLEIQKLAKQQDCEGILMYLEEHLKITQSDENVELCENHEVNAIAQHYLSRGRKKEIHMEFSLDIPDQSRIPDSVFGVLFGNLLENAMEACERQNEGQRFIQVKTSVVGGMLAIVVENSYEQEIQEDEGQLLSSKKEGEGSGIPAVREAAGQYDGMCRFTWKDGVFTASILLKI